MFYARVGTGGGHGGATLDDGTEQQANFYNSTTQGNVLVWQVSGLPYGTHTVTVRATGTHVVGGGNYVVIDHLEAID